MDALVLLDGFLVCFGRGVWSQSQGEKLLNSIDYRCKEAHNRGLESMMMMMMMMMMDPTLFTKHTSAWLIWIDMNEYKCGSFF